MKKLLLIAVAFLLIGVKTNHVQAQTLSVSAPWIWGCSPFQDSLWAIDTTNWQVVRRVGPTLAGFTITGMNGLATDPTTGITYVVMKVSGVTGRVLGTIDLMTGVCTSVTANPSTNNLGDNFSSITFDRTGQLYGSTGDGAVVPESLYKIDKATSVKTLMYAMGNGADGEVISYNRISDNIYHWSGNGTVIMERFPVSNVTYTPTNIPISGTAGGETFGMLYNGPTTFIVSNISSNLKRLSTSGAYDAATLSSNPDDLRGLVMLPYFNASDDTICQNESLTISGGGHQQFSHLYFHWGDGNSDSVVVINGVITNGTHMYSAPGSYSVTVETYNGFGGDTVYTYVIQVNNIPTVAISGFSTVCSGDSVTLTATSGGTSQWYMNGIMLVGETTNTYSTDQAGVYNMIKTNINGCADSAAVGTTVILGTDPAIALGPYAEGCGQVVLDANFPGTYLWSSGGTNQLDTVTASGNYSVVVTDSVGCVGTDTIPVTINPFPIVNIGPDTTVCNGILLDAG
ncbi:MAG TPA: hypothetical protein VK826_08115, partial [Bacteroidia bacterium]|nr:hypothetical protein [Bacteroidia bacterium]